MKNTVFFLCLGLCLCLLNVGRASAQGAPAPMMEVDFEQSQAVPGQPLMLRITVLVPTWLSKPVEFPDFEAPNLMVKLFEGATSPTSRSIEGETWSGVSRLYRVSPMIAGEIAIPEQTFLVSWAEPGVTDPKETEMTLDAFSIQGVLPDGADEITPFIAATKLVLEHQLSTENNVLKAGDSVTRTLSISVQGTSPLFVPLLIEPIEADAVGLYPAEPVVTEKIENNWLSGTRVETLSIVAQTGGTVQFPDIALKWYNLETGEVEEARAEGFELTVDAPVARQAPALDLRLIAGLASVLIGIVLVAWFLWPIVKRRIEAHLVARRASEAWAYSALCQAIKARDYNAVQHSLHDWETRAGLMQRSSEINAALLGIGDARYGTQRHPSDKEWNELLDAILSRRKSQARKDRTPTSFDAQPLNPS